MVFNLGQVLSALGLGTRNVISDSHWKILASVSLKYLVYIL